MAGLLLIFVFLFWGFISFKLSTAIAKVHSSGLARIGFSITLFTALFLAPIADDLLGSWQYKRYCEAGNEIAYLGTISVPPEVGLFTSDGAWKIASLGPSESGEKKRLGNLAESFVRWQGSNSVPTASIFPIRERETQLFDKASGKLVAKWKSFHFNGGFLRRGFLDSASQCFPNEFGNDLYRRIFVLESQ